MIFCPWQFVQRSQPVPSHMEQGVADWIDLASAWAKDWDAASPFNPLSAETARSNPLFFWTASWRSAQLQASLTPAVSCWR